MWTFFVFHVSLSNFILNNPAASITAKRKILNSCLNDSLSYGYETWGSALLRAVKTIYCEALNYFLYEELLFQMELFFIERGFLELKCDTQKAIQIQNDDHYKQW